MFRCLVAILIGLGIAATGAIAQTRTPSHCIALSQSIPEATYFQKATFFRDPLAEDSVQLSYIAHSAFLLRSAGGLSAVTDFTGYIGNVDFIPDIVTMNHAHDSHWTEFPDPAIAHVLRGWGPYGQGIQHHLDLGEMLVRNVSTDIRSWDHVEEKGNSIFVFEVAGLCIGHLGHLHHEPSDAQYAAMGRLDVVMAAVDGGMTVDLPTMMRILRRVRASVVVPMHWFEEWTLEAFLRGMSDDYLVVDAGISSLTLSLGQLPAQPTIMVLRPRYLQDP